MHNSLQGAISIFFIQAKPYPILFLQNCSPIYSMAALFCLLLQYLNFYFDLLNGFKRCVYPRYYCLMANATPIL